MTKRIVRSAQGRRKPQSMKETPQEWVQRMIAKMAVPEPNTGCLLWFGAAIGRRGVGYPVAQYQRKTVSITRTLLGLPRGVHCTQPDLLACHHCDTPLCVNVEHLFIGTPSDNTQDAIRKGRAYCHYAGVSECWRGHPFTPENTYRRANGSRKCKACDYERKRQKRARAA